MYWEASAETMDRDELEQVQLERLQATLARVARNVPHYRAALGAFGGAGFEPGDVKSLSDVTRLPFTDKSALRKAGPFGMFATPMRDVVRLQASSGSTGQAIVTGYTRNDVKRWADLTARVLTAGGVGRDDVVHVAYAFGLFTGGFGFNYGAERLGAAVIPAGGGATRKQIQILQEYRATALVCTPSFALHLAEALDEAGVNPNALTLKWGLFGAETWTEAMRKEIELRLKVAATDNYGLSELMGPGVAGECLERSGMHVSEDHFLAEIIDPATLAPVKDGETGELVLTSLTREACPLIRYRTGDLTRFVSGDCPCGRTMRRIDRILGRTDDMLIIKGVNVFPSQIEAVLLEVEGTMPHYQIILEREKSLDKATLLVEVIESIIFDRLSEQLRLAELIKNRLRSELGVGFEVRLVEPRSLAARAQDSETAEAPGKVRRVIDKRR